MHGTAAHGVVHIRRDGRGFAVHRVVLRQLAHAGVRVEVGLPVQLAVGVGGREGVAGHPVALLQAEDVDAGLCQAPYESCARSPGPDYQHVGNIVVD